MQPGIKECKGAFLGVTYLKKYIQKYIYIYMYIDNTYLQTASKTFTNEKHKRNENKTSLRS